MNWLHGVIAVVFVALLIGLIVGFSYLVWWLDHVTVKYPNVGIWVGIILATTLVFVLGSAFK